MIIDVHTHILKPGYDLHHQSVEMPKDFRGWPKDQQERWMKICSLDEYFNAIEHVCKYDSEFTGGGTQFLSSDKIV